MRNYFLEALGFGYIINHPTKEIHKVKNLKGNCKTYLIKDIRYGNGLYVFILIKFFEYNGCYHCFKSQNTD